jgi:ABC-type nickel/cobalt efflux system permease component RcnA
LTFTFPESFSYRPSRKALKRRMHQLLNRDDQRNLTDHAIVISLLTGTIAGMLHVFSGPDHLAAVAPMTAHRSGRGWRTGLCWGLGHSGGVLLVGGLLLLFRELLPLEILSSWAERMVGVLLVGIGLWGLRKALSSHLHAHEHSHEGKRHVHIHVHDRETAHVHAHPSSQLDEESKSHSHTHAAVGIGTLHGLAGSAHFLGVLPALAFPTRLEAIGYLMAFAVGTIIAMVLFTSTMSWLVRGSLFKGSGVRGYRFCMGLCSVTAIGVGLCWLSL